MKLKIIVPTQEEIAKRVYSFIEQNGEGYRKVVMINIPKEIISSIPKKSFEDLKEDLIGIIKPHHNIEELKEFAKKLEEYWDPLNDLFFSNISKITGHDWKFKEYLVHISFVIRGMYSLTNEVYSNPLGVKTCAFIMSEELFHLHYWDIFRNVIKNEKCPWWNNKKVWEISETIPDFIFAENCFDVFGWGKKFNRTYPFLDEYKKKLLPKWESRISFDDFIKEIHIQVIG